MLTSSAYEWTRNQSALSRMVIQNIFFLLFFQFKCKKPGLFSAINWISFSVSTSAVLFLKKKDFEILYLFRSLLVNDLRFILLLWFSLSLKSQVIEKASVNIDVTCLNSTECMQCKNVGTCNPRVSKPSGYRYIIICFIFLYNTSFNITYFIINYFILLMRSLECLIKHCLHLLLVS